MCGIAGIACFESSSHPTIQQLRTMCDVIKHRGPDEEGIDIQETVAMGMRRLSVIDVEGGSQPIFNEDRTVRLVYNGEIYNFRELRSNLESKGHRFSSNTDSEVIVHGYEEHGEDIPKYLNGMFAFVLHDMRQKKLLLARDHIGIKPLYYSIDERYLIWGSEIKVLLASGLIDKELDIDSLGEYLAWEYVPGKRTLLKGVFSLEPGNMISLDLGSAKYDSRQYWDIPLSSHERTGNGKEWEDRVEEQVEKSVKRQLVSDVPLGAFLSGGVDSSLIVSCMGSAKTFSIGFDDPSYNELKWSKKVADHLKVDHVTKIIKPDLEELFYRLIYFMDDPIGDFSIYPTYLVSKLAREHVTVSLSGDGGDELFGGYETYMAEENVMQYNLIPRVLRKKLVEPLINNLKPRAEKKGLVNKAKRFVEGLGHSEELFHARWRVFLGEKERNGLFTGDASSKLHTPVGTHIFDLFHKAGRRSPINRCLYVDLKSYLCDNILLKVDRMSMAVSLEARVPYLDRELVELAFKVPDSFKVNRHQTKVLLKKIASKRIPRDCVYRGKEGFSIPIKNWLVRELRPLMEELLQEKVVREDAIFNYHEIRRLKDDHLQGRANNSHVLWALMVYHAWKNMWVKGIL